VPGARCAGNAGPGHLRGERRAAGGYSHSGAIGGRQQIRGQLVKTLAAVGTLLLAAGVLLMTVPLHHGTIPQWNGLCTSGVGQIGQLIDSTAQQDCGSVSLADHLIGWLIGGGLAALAAASLLWLTRQHRASA
jgi:hypothetical protein